MKSILSITLLFVSAGILSAQKIEKYYNYDWQEVDDASRARFYSLVEKNDSIWSRKDYYLREGTLQMQGYYRDADCKIEDGAFTWYHSNGYLKMRGNYVNGKKRGIWLSYHENGMMSDSIFYDEHGWITGTSLGWHENGIMADSTVLNPDGSGVSVFWWENGNPSAAGRYSAGKKKNGKWQYFHSNGQIASIESYDNDQLVDKSYYDENGVKQSDTANHDRQASFPGGLAAWQKYLKKNLYFPSRYKLVNGDEAVVMVRFAVTEDGSISDVTVTIPLHPDFDKLALEVIKRSPKWLPAVSHNRKIKEYHQQPVTFAQE